MPPPRIYVHGIFDLFHYGHTDLLCRVRDQFGPDAIILAGVCSESDFRHRDIRKPVLSQAERVRSVSACRYVDAVMDAPWRPDQAFLDKHQIDRVIHNGDTMMEGDDDDDIYAYVKSVGAFMTIPGAPAISTHEIKQRIIHQNDMFVDPFWSRRWR